MSTVVLYCHWKVISARAGQQRRKYVQIQQRMMQHARQVIHYIDMHPLSSAMAKELSGG